MVAPQNEEVFVALALTRVEEGRGDAPPFALQRFADDGRVLAGPEPAGARAIADLERSSPGIRWVLDNTSAVYSQLFGSACASIGVMTSRWSSVCCVVAMAPSENLRPPVAVLARRDGRPVPPDPHSRAADESLTLFDAGHLDRPPAGPEDLGAAALDQTTTDGQ